MKNTTGGSDPNFQFNDKSKSSSAGASPSLRHPIKSSNIGAADPAGSTNATRPVERSDATYPVAPSNAPVPVARAIIAGLLMGMANLVPGISGGTMILVMGLYDEFVTAVADVVRLRLTKKNVLLLTVIVAAAGVSITTLASVMSRAVTLHQSAMFSLFIGLTLGGVPALMKMLKRPTTASMAGVVIGLVIMIAIALSRNEPPDRQAIRDAVASGSFVVEPAYGTDVGAGVLGIAAMILPGISGAYMLLILGRYETILAAIALAKRYALSFGAEGDPLVFLRVLIPTAAGAMISLVLFSNLLKWLLHRHEQVSVGALLGTLLGSVIGIWPFDAGSTLSTYLVGLILAFLGFGVTVGLSRVTR